MKVLYLPNEQKEGDQVGPRAFFESLKASGDIDLEVNSFLVEERRSGSGQALERILDTASAFAPDVIFWQHIGRFPITFRHLEHLRNLKSRPVIVYHEADVYGWRKPATASMSALATVADVVFLVGLGPFARLFRKLGARRIEYAPHNYDVTRFGNAPVPPANEARRFDAVMIGNRLTPIAAFMAPVRWLRMSGARSRELVARALGRVLGPRFGLFGSGWDGFIGNQGPSRYEDQERIQQQSWLSVGWDHFETVDGYFSDRLPIALASGVAHVTHYHPGYEQVLGDCRALRFARNPEGIVRAVESLLVQPRSSLRAMGEDGRAFAARTLSTPIVFRKMWDTVLETWEGRA